MSSEHEPSGVFEGPEVLDGLIDAANSASADARTVYLTFLLAGTYVAITIGSTTDEQLLRLTAVDLPVLGVGVPIVAFYTLVPWLIVVLHLNLLLQLYFLARRLHPLADRFRRGISHWTDRLHSFPFTHYVVGSQRGLVGGVLTTIVVTSFLLFPLALLIGAQLRFLPYHDAVLTWSQRAAILADLLLLWIFWPMIRETGMSWSQWFKGLFRGLRKATSDCAQWRPGGKARLSQVLGDLAKSIGRANNVFYLSLFSLAVVAFSVFIATVPGEGVETALGGSAIPSARKLLFESPQSPFQRNLQLAEAVLVQGEPPAELLRALEAGRLDTRSGQSVEERRDALRRIRGIDLSGRDLRGADLRKVVLVNADLRGADLSHAVLRDADLEGANLHPLFTPAGCTSEEQRMELSSGRSLEGSRLVLPPHDEGDSIEVCATLVEEADLVNASMRSVELPLALLAGADLQGADLDGAHLWRVDLSRARLQNSRFAGAKLENAKLRGVRAHGAVFADAMLARADLTEARMPFADISAASLQGAVLRGANLRAVSGAGAHLEGADLQGAMLEDANLEASLLTGASFAGARIAGLVLGQLAFNDLRGLVTTPLSPEAFRRENPPPGRSLAKVRGWTFVGPFPTDPSLCDANPVLRSLGSSCIGEDQIDEWVQRLAGAACDHEGAAFGIAQQALTRPGTPEHPLVSYGPALARTLLAAECPGAQGLPKELREALAERATARE